MDTKEVLGEITRELQRSDDVDAVTRIQKNKAELSDLIIKRENEIQDILREHLANLERLESEASSPPAAVLRERQSELLHKQREMKAAIAKLEQEVQTQENQLQALDAVLAGLEKQRAEVYEYAEQKIPTVKSSLRLYTNICSINWDYNTDDIKGVVNMSNKQEVRPFHMKKTADKVEVADALWEMLWEDKAHNPPADSVVFSV